MMKMSLFFRGWGDVSTAPVIMDSKTKIVTFNILIWEQYLDSEVSADDD